MTSLFSSFDCYLFYSCILILTATITLAMKPFCKVSLFGSFLTYFAFSLEEFYTSLKPKLYAKGLFGFILCSFLVVAGVNLYSVFPFIFPFSSQISVIFMLSLTIWGGFLGFSLLKNVKGFFSHSVPTGSPLGLSFFLFLIELISNVIRPITLMVRLCANILAGHLLMILLSTLIFSLPIFLPFYVLLNLVELAVGLIQSYILCTMSCLYFSEV